MRTEATDWAHGVLDRYDPYGHLPTPISTAGALERARATKAGAAAVAEIDQAEAALLAEGHLLPWVKPVHGNLRRVPQDQRA